MSLTFILHKYKILGKKGEGTFSDVLKCQDLKDSSLHACKKMKQHYENIDQVNNLREIQAMRRLSPHPHILELEDILFDKKSGTLVLVLELMDMNIYELIKGRRHFLPDQKIRNYMYQLCKALDHMHKNGIFHRDVKPENILIRNDSLKLADFGSCRSIYSKQPYTEYISTRWYRAPECLLTDGYYGYKMDMWSVGCVMFEIMSLHPLFPGSNEVDQIAKIHDVVGTPEAIVLNKLRHKTRGVNFNFPSKKGTGLERLMPQASPESLDLIYKLCLYDPDERMTAKHSLRHPYFKELRDADRRTQKLQKEQADAAASTVSIDLPGGLEEKGQTDENRSEKETERSQKSNIYENGRHKARDSLLELTHKYNLKLDFPSKADDTRKKDKTRKTPRPDSADSSITTTTIRSLRYPNPNTGSLLFQPKDTMSYLYKMDRKRQKRQQTDPISESNYRNQYMSGFSYSHGLQPSFLPKVKASSSAATATFLPTIQPTYSTKPSKSKVHLQSNKSLHSTYLPSIDKRG